MNGENFVEQLNKLSLGLISPKKFSGRNHVNRQFINRLSLETTLEGHQGCVNCLEWNEKGTRLVSGSDDCCVILWDPFEHKSIFTMNTGHAGNVFSVKFLPGLNDCLLVTGAADAKVRVHDMNRMETRHVFACHSGRIKRLANSPSEPSVFWSAAEDGTVRQYDLRDPEQASSNSPCNVLVSLHEHIGSFAEAKCIATNPMKPEMLAVGSNDPYVRVYDRRNLSLHTFDAPPRTHGSRRVANASNMGIASTVPPDSVRYFVPGHLPCKEVSQHRCSRHVNVTCVSFSADGRDMLANMGGDHVYLFDLNQPVAPYHCQAYHGLLMLESGSNRRLSTLENRADRISARFQSRPFEAIPSDQISTKAARFVKAKAHVAAVRAYNELIHQCPFDPQLYTGRATALLKRGWNGDVYSALRDCQTTIKLMNTFAVDGTEQHKKSQPTVFPHHQSACIQATALLLSTRCLLRLDWIGEARMVLDKLQHEYPDLIAPLPPSQHVPSHESTTDGRRNGHTVAVVSSAKTNLHYFYQLLDNEVRQREEAFHKSEDRLSKKKQPSPMEDESVFIYESAVSSENRGTSRSDGNTTQSRQRTRSSSARRINEQMSSCSCIGCVTRQTESDMKNENIWRASALDYNERFLGHCNAITDIKEANFFGSNGQYIVAGSDCGSFFIWDRETTNIVRILDADSSTVNCVQPHPSTCLLASSGIDSVVRLWAPQPEDETEQVNVIRDHVGAAEQNQRRLIADPLEIMLLNMGYRIPGLNAGFTRRSRRVRSQRRHNENRHRSSSDDDDEGMVDSMDTHMEVGHLDDSDNGDDSDDASRATNPEDLEGFPEVPGANVFLTEPSEFSDQNLPPLSNCQGDNPSTFSVDGNASEIAPPDSKRSRSETSGSLQPTVAHSVFIDDSPAASSSDDRIPQSSIDATRSAASVPIITVDSVLWDNEPLLLFGPTSGRERSRTGSTDNDNHSTANRQSSDNDVGDGVLELPCRPS